MIRRPFIAAALAAAAALIGAAPAASATAPTATTGPVTAVGPTTATVSGSVNPNGASTTAYFEYGTTKTFGAQTVPQNAGTDVPKTIGRSLTGLIPSTTYYYRAAATSTVGTAFGKTFSFTTKSS